MSDETKVTETQIPEETSEETAGAAPSEAPAKTAAEPEAPAESMADFEDAINASFKPVHEGDILTGTVIGVSEDEIILDFGG